MSYITKFIMWILMNTMRIRIRLEQCGFVKDTGTRNAIFMLRMISERMCTRIHYWQPQYIQMTQVGLCITKDADLLGFSRTAISWIYRDWLRKVKNSSANFLILITTFLHSGPCCYSYFFIYSSFHIWWFFDPLKFLDLTRFMI